jgi:hypothetical protein
LYLVVRAQQRQISELVRFTEEINSRIKKWEMFFGDKFATVFAGEVGTTEDKDLQPIELPEHLAKGFGALLNGDGIAGNAPPTFADMPVQDTEPHHVLATP